jgi:hypothetical protein
MIVKRPVTLYGGHACWSAATADKSSLVSTYSSQRSGRGDTMTGAR